MRSKFTAVLSAAALLASACLVWGQAETGQITGTVTDPSGAVVPSAAVKVLSPSTGAERTTTASSNGDFAVPNLLPGDYTLVVQAAGFKTFEEKVTLTVGQRVGLDVKLQVGQTGTTVEVSSTAVKIDTETQTLSTTVTQQQVRELPSLTRNPYDFVALSGNVSDAAAGMRGVGFAINGQREASTNVLLNGAANNNEFTASVGQQVPLDSVQEFSVLTNNFTAEYGRAGGGVVNVVTKSGTNAFHGSLYEYNRVSYLSSNTFNNNANSIPKSTFTRNQFGYSVGGPIKKDKLFFFSSTEWIRVRSAAAFTAILATPQFIADTAPGVQAFFNAYGKLAPSDTVLATYNGTQQNLCGTNSACQSFVAANPNLPIFQKVAYVIPGNAGGGDPQNQYQTVARVDYDVSDRTQMYVNYALQSANIFPGFASASPYEGYNTGENDFNNNVLYSITHTFTPTLVSQSKAVFNRLNQLQPFGPAGGNIPTLFTGTAGVTQLVNTNVLFPGYNPSTPGSSIPFGGPQNFVQLYEDLSYTRGKHSFRFGGSFDYQRDNRTFGAYEDGGYYLGAGTGSLGQSIANLLAGTAYQFQAAIYPQGSYPGQVVNYPLTEPNFSRSNRYREGAVYGQDSWKISPRFTANIGLRWEYFGVQHNKNASLDSNFYDPNNQIDTPLGINQGQVYVVPNSPYGSLWNPSKHNFAPRLGFAWDVFGDGKTSLRGGYGIGYERNFGNVTFNVIQNPPNYETISITSSNYAGPITISPANLGPFSKTSGTLKLPRASLRNVDYHIQQAFANFWSTSLEHQFTNNFVVGVDYTGSRGVHLYDIEVLNRAGYGNVFLGIPCDGAAFDCLSYLNPQYSGINRRGSKGWSNYNGLNLHAKLDDSGHSGLTLTAAYTWSKALDNLSSTFSDTDSTCSFTNNGCFNVGYLDPYAPMLDKGPSDFDITQRVSLSAIWNVPAFKNGNGLAHQILGGWQLAPIFEARTGSPYSIFDGSNSYTDYARAGLLGPVPIHGSGNPPSNGAPNSFNYLSFADSLVDHFVNPIYGWSDLPPFPAYMTGRNAFRSPGFWNLDLGIYKNFSVTERVQVQLRGEAYNLFNHANLYVVGTSADVSNVVPTDGGTFSVTSCRACTGATYDRRNLQLALRVTF
ncbi:MAG: TonB-dependent receptor [Acidobacteriaceae bacterium]|nr:TonB-dependent receptor [Acidobacteriaceae bacterium]